MNLFIREDFISHAGLPLTWKVECDALSEGDYEALAKIVSEKFKFKDVVGIPRGGIPFENALKQFASNDENDPLLICDDVYTTGTSMSCLLYTSPSPRDGLLSRMPSSA